MQLFFVLTVLMSFILAENVKELHKDAQEKSSIKASIKDYISTTETFKMNPHLNSLWVYHPVSHKSQQSDDDGIHNVAFKTSHFVTRLAKTLAFGFEPYFSKDYFEPFETRRKPVTLVAFRKNGLLAQKVPRIVDKSSEIAELQSPFNDISNFWQNEPGL